MEKDQTPGIIDPKKRRGESRWQRFWRKRRMNSLRNSSDHAMFMAIVLLASVLALGALAYLALKGTKFDSGAKPPAMDFLK